LAVVPDPIRVNIEAIEHPSMSSRIKPLWTPEAGERYVVKEGEYVIKADNSFEEILFHMMGEISGSPEDRYDELEAILETIQMSELEAYLKRYGL
jgi:hypothetical protein